MDTGASHQLAARPSPISPARVLLTLLVLGLIGQNSYLRSSEAISIKPADFDRLVMSCYLGGSSSSINGFQSVYQSPSSNTNQQPASANQSPTGANYNSYSSGQFGRQTSFSGQNGGSPASQQAPAYYAGADPNRGSSVLGNNGGSSASASSFATGRLATGGFLDSSSGANNFFNLGQTIPRANTIDNFIALLSKIEAANPRLANNPDQLIRSLLGRFRMDNYYYDVRSQTPISDQNRRQTSDILPAVMGQSGVQQQQQQYMNSDMFPEQLLDQNEKCSMYFMLSHFIDKTTLFPNQPLGAQPITQLAGPLNNQRPPVLQAAGAGYPAQSANLAYNSASGSGGSGAGVGGSGPARYPGPSPSFGSPATSNMNSFGAGISNNLDYNGKNNYGVNVLQPGNQYNQAIGNRNRDGSYGTGSAGQYSSNPRPVAPYIDAASGRQSNSNSLPASSVIASSRGDERLATEFGVVTVMNQDNAALVLNRVLLGLLAATTPAQTIRQLAATIYPTQQIMLTTPRLDEELDPLYAVTLADLWAISSIPKAGKPFDIRLLGDNGRWNDTICPTAFTLERSSNIRFTTAELLGGIDGFNLGLLRRRLLSMRRNIKLSELLKMYYSKSGFQPQFGEFGVCNRQGPMLSYFDDLHRQAETYLRLYQLDLPIKDNEISLAISRLEAFKDLTRQIAQQFTPQELCQSESSSGFDSLYPMSGQDQCEIAKSDLVAVLDSSPMANQQFQQLVVIKLAQKLGLSREGSSLSIMTNQQDTTGAYGASGGFGFNTIVRNSTNTAEIGCALVRDQSASYQGGQITDPTRLMEMFERALINLDSEYLTRQNIGLNSLQSSSSSSYRPSYVSTWFGSSSEGGYASSNYMLGSQGGGPRNTGGSKVIVWFNYGSQTRPSQISSGPTNWNGPSSNSYQSGDQLQYKFYEAKKYLRENFRGASILALANSREDVKPFVYNEERDLFLDIPQGSSSGLMSTSADYYPSSSSTSDPTSLAMLSGPAEQMVGKLLQRMCTIPALFQYPMCFRVPSENTVSVGYISPGRKQYWMMAPKTFFASRSVRLVFKVDGGRLRVCFGRKPNPDETAQRNPNKDQQPTMFQPSAGSSSIAFANNPNGGLVNQQPSTPAPTPTSSDYYTGMEYGVCKDVSPGQEIDFLISDPCYHKSIAECEPFYFVIRETSNPGEGDPNYMCRDDGCKRFDQARFIMTHTGVSCSSALKSVKANHLLIMISSLIAIYLLGNWNGESRIRSRSRRAEAAKREAHAQKCLLRHSATAYKYHLIAIMTIVATSFCKLAQAQHANVYDYGQNRYGEKRGSYTPPEVLAIILVVMVILGGLALTIGLCYYVTKQRTRGMQPVEQTEH